MIDRWVQRLYSGGRTWRSQHLHRRSVKSQNRSHRHRNRIHCCLVRRPKRRCVCLSLCMSVCVSVCMSACASVCQHESKVNFRQTVRNALKQIWKSFGYLSDGHSSNGITLRQLRVSLRLFLKMYFPEGIRQKSMQPN